MRYLCLVYQDEAALAALSPAEHDAFAEEMRAYREELRQGGHDVASFPLQPVRTATTLRVRDGNLSISDGPVAGCREQLGGFYLIEARDLNGAIRLAARMPPARLGAIEVRPLQECYPS